ncbi:MAG TPA: L,D-transpeptidase family protein [Allosphingosinicella sp.]|nr:L,D-transpeptidase family protein [Allosphingosinicella sp.]
MQNRSRLAAFTLLLAWTASPVSAQLEPGEAPTQEQVATGEVPATPISEAETVYRSFGGTMVAPAWNRPAAEDLLAYVERIAEDGLDPADYRPDALRAALAGTDQQALDRAATDSFLRLSADLALGHVPMAARENWHLKDNDLDGADQFGLMRRAIQDNSVRDSLNSLLPTHPQYAELKGVLASATSEAVIEKVRANLDRWRWLPRDLGPRYVIVNVPAFTVALVEDGRVVARHRAVVGAPKTATPQLGAVATGVILNPWWEVPASITPEVRGKRGYVRVKAGESFRYRQPPGPGNALGRMKVVMPNNYAIYLHDTPAKSLFSKPSRAFSHGCIRTQDALGFAEALLGSPEWDRSAIDAAVASGETIEAKAATPTPVYIAYFTAAAAKDQGGIVSYRDIYGRDAGVAMALKDRSGTALASAAE